MNDLMQESIEQDMKMLEHQIKLLQDQFEKKKLMRAKVSGAVGKESSIQVADTGVTVMYSDSARGLGLFAMKDFQPGAYVASFSGAYYDDEEAGDDQTYMADFENTTGGIDATR